MSGRNEEVTGTCLTCVQVVELLLISPGFITSPGVTNRLPEGITPQLIRTYKNNIVVMNKNIVRLRGNEVGF